MWKLCNMIAQILEYRPTFTITKICISVAWMIKYLVCVLLIFMEHYNCTVLVHPLFFYQNVTVSASDYSKSKMNSALYIVVNLIGDNFQALSTEYIFQNCRLSKPKSLDFECKNLKLYVCKKSVLSLYLPTQILAL